jgi:NAD(P)-dependent dehydrogenase (short-subunit alcohol dehydrogenase family)
MKPPPHVVLLTGAGGDLGRALAREFARQGAVLALCDLLPRTAGEQALPGLLAEGAAAAHYRSVDVTDASALQAFVAEIGTAHGPPTVCIVNAGVVERGSLLDLSAAAWRRTLEVNLTGAYLTARAAAQAMVAAGRAGQIVFIGSWVQDVPRANIGAYCASKSGLKMLARCLALELAPHGIRVNTMAPGWIDAGLTGKNLQAHPELRAGIEAQIPLGRLGSAEEVARAVRMLCSDDAGYVTGATLVLDGGSSLGAAG